ncbi:tetratricopeptide repeat protein [Planctomycetota bacterium]
MGNSRQSTGRINRKASSHGIPTSPPAAGGAARPGGGRHGPVRPHRYYTARPARIVYHDRPSMVRHHHRYDYSYRDYLGVLRYRVIWPRYRVMVHYGYGPRYSWRYFYPYYHRKYLFISLGGYWPSWCHYQRYYWYGCHPYNWYGYYPVAREVQGPTYNYYTYNYYTDDNSTQAADSSIFEQIGDQERGPDQITLADVYFEEAVKAFEEAKYHTATTKFARALELAPNDQILPFAYSQALIATENYPEAAKILREALANVRPEEEGVFYPRGLYADEDVLLDQIDRLTEKAEMYTYDADLQLLLGYQLLGIGEVDRAVEPLIHSSEDLVNAKAAGILLQLAEKIKTSNIEREESQPAPSPAQSKAFLQRHILEPEETVLVSDIEEDISESLEPNPAPAQNEAVFAKNPVKTEEAIYIEDKPERSNFSPALARSPTTNSKHPTKWKGAMFLASVCAIATSAGIRGYLRG